MSWAEKSRVEQNREHRKHKRFILMNSCIWFWTNLFFFWLVYAFGPKYIISNVMFTFLLIYCCYFSVDGICYSVCGHIDIPLKWKQMKNINLSIFHFSCGAYWIHNSTASISHDFGRLILLFCIIRRCLFRVVSVHS